MKFPLPLAMMAVCISSEFASAAPLWSPIDDDVYLQETGRQVKTEVPLTGVAVFGNRVYASDAKTIYVVNGETLEELSGAQGPITGIKALGDALWVLSNVGLQRYDGIKWQLVLEGGVTDLCDHLGQIIAATSTGLVRVDAETPVPITDSRGGADHVESYAESIYCTFGDRIGIWTGANYDFSNVADWGERLPGTQIRDILVRGSKLFFATDQGLGVLRGMAISSIRGEDGLPYEDTRCLAPGFDGDTWVGTHWGAVRITNGEYHYFAGPRWLPGNSVNAVASMGQSVYIATDGGLGIIDYVPYTLQKKALFYERHLTEWGQYRLGFTHKLEWDRESNQWMREISDNDVGWSTHYLAAMCFKYAVTGDKDAKAKAIDAFEAMKWSEEITSIDGFPARSIWAVGEKGHKAMHGSGGLPAEWHLSEDGQFEWKGDTSSDETDAHIYAAAIFHDLVADENYKTHAKEHIHRIVSHLVDNGFVLRDVDGLPTRWGRWDPAYLDTPLGFYARGLNGFEALTYLRTAATLTGDPKFEDAYKQYQTRGYLPDVLRLKLIFHPGFVNHSDDRMAFYLYYTMLKYETDPVLRSIYRRSLERSWEIERIESNPWFNFIYGAITGNDCESLQAVRHMREWPLDMVAHPFHNSHRADIHPIEDYIAYAGGVRAFSPRERGGMRWTDGTVQPDGGSGQEVVDPSGFLDAYWMGRYHGFIKAPRETDPALVHVESRNLHLGAEPYAGPARPSIGK
ncbi:MAG: hypothetical protein AMXMBFR84_35880 [Candidatus Hydrogenedentota bacterium]